MRKRRRERRRILSRGRKRDCRCFVSLCGSPTEPRSPLLCHSCCVRRARCVRHARSRHLRDARYPPRRTAAALPRSRRQRLSAARCARWMRRWHPPRAPACSTSSCASSSGRRVRNRCRGTGRLRGLARALLRRRQQRSRDARVEARHLFEMTQMRPYQSLQDFGATGGVGPEPRPMTWRPLILTRQSTHSQSCLGRVGPHSGKLPRPRRRSRGCRDCWLATPKLLHGSRRCSRCVSSLRRCTPTPSCRLSVSRPRG